MTSDQLTCAAINQEAGLTNGMLACAAGEQLVVGCSGALGVGLAALLVGLWLLRRGDQAAFTFGYGGLLIMAGALGMPALARQLTDAPYTLDWPFAWTVMWFWLGLGLAAAVAHQVLNVRPAEAAATPAQLAPAPDRAAALIERLPAALREPARQTHAVLHDAARRSQTQPDAAARQLAGAMLGEYLPDSLGAYLAVSAAGRERPLPGGQTPTTLLTGQLDLLRNGAARLLAEGDRAPLDGLLIQDRFLRSRLTPPADFEVGDSEPPAQARS